MCLSSAAGLVQGLDIDGNVSRVTISVCHAGNSTAKALIAIYICHYVQFNFCPYASRTYLVASLLQKREMQGRVPAS